MKHDTHPYRAIGRWFFWRYRNLAKEKGVRYADLCMRKCGTPPAVRARVLSPEGFAPPPRRGTLDRFFSFFR